MRTRRSLTRPSLASSFKSTPTTLMQMRALPVREYDAFYAGRWRARWVSPIGVQEGDRQLRALDVCVVAQARERDRRVAQPGTLPAGVHRVVLAAGQDLRDPRSCQQLRHVRRPDGERARVHGQPPSPVLLPQARIHGGGVGGQQAGQTRDAQIAGGSLLTRGEPGHRPARRALRAVQVTLMPRPMTAWTGTENLPLARARATTPPSECPSTTARAPSLARPATAAA